MVIRHHLRDQDPLSSSSFQNFLPATFRSDLQNTRLPRLEGPDDNEVSRSLNAMNDDTRQDIDVRKGSVNGRNVPLMVVKELHQRLVSLSKTRWAIDWETSLLLILASLLQAWARFPATRWSKSRGQ